MAAIVSQNPRLPMLFYRLLIATALVFLAACGTIVKSNAPLVDGISLNPFAYKARFDSAPLLAQWIIVPQYVVGKEVKTSVMLPGTVVPLYIGSGKVHHEFLLTETEQQDIGVRLAESVGYDRTDPLCTATLTFSDVDYMFELHQFWATARLRIERNAVIVLNVEKRFWSAEGMSFGQKMNTNPKLGKQALARQLIDYFANTVAGADIPACSHR
jgi:hypothetical protein